MKWHTACSEEWPLDRHSCLSDLAISLLLMCVSVRACEVGRQLCGCPSSSRGLGLGLFWKLLSMSALVAVKAVFTVQAGLPPEPLHGPPEC